MFTGIFVRVGTIIYGVNESDFLNNLIPVLGTIGLILIVLEGGPRIRDYSREITSHYKRVFSQGIILILNIVAISLAFEHLLGMTPQAAVIYATPLSIISSAVAIPSSAGSREQEKEFVVYESTFSDILGIMTLIMPFANLKPIKPLLAESLVALGLQILGVIVVSLLITFCLFYLLQRIEHHVKFFRFWPC